MSAAFNLQQAAVIGAGTMGRGIVISLASAGIPVLWLDNNPQMVEAGLQMAEDTWAQHVAKGRISTGEASLRRARIQAVADYAELAEVDLVIEAATEREDIKRRIFESVAQHLQADAILASNTSSIPITRMAAAVPDPARFIGVHFFNPVPVMGLIELIRGLATSDATVAAVEAFGRSLGKEIVHAQDAPGFIVNRVLMPMLNEAVFALGEGVASIRDIDTACRLGLNHPMGPLTLADFIGLDTCLEIIRVLHSTTGDPKFRPAPLLVKYVEAGWLGKKSGRGFYDWTGAEPVPTR